MSPNFKQISLPQTCYDIAYFILPRLMFSELDRIKMLFLEYPHDAGKFLYSAACQARRIEPNLDTAPQFHCHHRTFDDSREFFVLEYPAPPTADIEEPDPVAVLTDSQVFLSSVKQIGVLAPFFSAILCRDSVDAEYYILGQAPYDGTTLRSLDRDGNNRNRGPGPEPTLDAFIDAIRERSNYIRD